MSVITRIHRRSSPPLFLLLIAAVFALAACSVNRTAGNVVIDDVGHGIHADATDAAGEDADVEAGDGLGADADAETGDVETGDGETDECPTARPLCMIVGSGVPASTHIATQPLVTLSCDGRQSEAGSGRITRYSWSVVARPDGSMTDFQPNNAARSEFLVDMTGQYTLQLEVENDQGCSSEPAEVVVVARPPNDFYLELVWDTPGDTNPDDTGMGMGADLDLHFLHATNGCWGDPKWDLSFRNRLADWGVQGDVSDNPSFGIDDTDGWGPEAILFDKPEEGVTYMVAVHSYDEWGYGPSFATLRIYGLGELLFEGRKQLAEQDDWWIVASMTWPGPTVTPIDRIYSTHRGQFPPCPLPEP